MHPHQNVFKIKPGIPVKILLFLSVSVFFLPVQAQASTQTVSLPLTIDYPLLKSIVMKTVYTDQGQTAILLNENEGCTKVTISEPSIREEDSQILFETKAHIVAGDLRCEHLCNAC
jgi:hypothetical protein